LTRQNVPISEETARRAREGVALGGYILCDPLDGPPQAILIATGSEVALAVEARRALEAGGVPTRVVSMPCWEFFDRQPREYRDQILPPAVRPRLAIEAGASLGWANYVGEGGGSVSLDRYGASAPGEVVLRELGFNVENVVARARALL
jgi:transketolase